MELIKRHACFGGEQQIYRHASRETGCDMELSVYLPPQVVSRLVPVLFYLSGLTCTWANVTEKAGAQRAAAEQGVALVCPDTSPRGAGLLGEDADYDFGSGAGFYVDATEAPWSRHYRMYSYVCAELPGVLAPAIPEVDFDRIGIFGHSMGGHGALVAAFRNPELFQSVSAFAPIVTPADVPWGQKAFTGYLGTDRSALARLRQHSSGGHDQLAAADPDRPGGR